MLSLIKYLKLNVLFNIYSTSRVFYFFCIESHFLENFPFHPDLQFYWHKIIHYVLFSIFTGFSPLTICAFSLFFWLVFQKVCILLVFQRITCYFCWITNFLLKLPFSLASMRLFFSASLGTSLTISHCSLADSKSELPHAICSSLLNPPFKNLLIVLNHLFIDVTSSSMSSFHMPCTQIQTHVQPQAHNRLFEGT